MNQQAERIRNLLLSGWALIPATMLLLACYIFAGLAVMTAEDFDRPMNTAERVLFLLPLAPGLWLAVILTRIGFKARQAQKQSGV